MATLQNYMSGLGDYGGLGDSRLNQTRAQYFKQTPWNSTPLFRSGDEMNNSQEWANMPMTNDMLNAAEGMKRVNSSRNAFQRGNYLKSMYENQLLDSATDDELQYVLTGPPRTEREAQLQKVIKTDYDARERGAQLIPTLKNLQDSKKRQLVNDQLASGLLTDKQARELNPQKFALDVAQFNQQVENQGAQREHADKQLSAQERYRQAQKENAAATLQQRGEIQQQNYGQRQQFHADSQSNFRSEADRKYYQDVAAGAASGALTPQQVTQMFQRRFDPATMTMLRGYAQRYLDQNSFGQDGQAAAQNDPGFFSKLGSMIGFGSGTSPVPPQGVDFSGNDDGSGADEGFSLDMGIGNSLSPQRPMGQSYGMPPSYGMPASYENRQPSFRPGSTVRNFKTGEEFRISQNGRFVPVPRISAAAAAGGGMMERPDGSTYQNGSDAPVNTWQAPPEIPFQGPPAPPVAASYFGPPVPAPVTAAPKPSYLSRIPWKEGAWDDFQPYFDAARKGTRALDYPRRGFLEALSSGMLQIPAVRQAYGLDVW